MVGYNLNDAAVVYQKIRMSHNLTPVDMISLVCKLGQAREEIGYPIKDLMNYAEDDIILRDVGIIYNHWGNMQQIKNGLVFYSSTLN